MTDRDAPRRLTNSTWIGLAGLRDQLDPVTLEEE